MNKYIGALLCLLMTSVSYAAEFSHFITAEGNILKDGKADYRFISFNVPTLNYQEDNLKFRETNPYRLPSEFEMRDIFATVKEMGGQVIRIYTIPVRNTGFPKESPTYVEAPNQFNEEAFKVTDMMLALANEYGIRIIFPLLNNRQWMGGRPNYAAFRGKTAEEFWTDRQLIEDFKATINFTLNRVNTITGVSYKDDKAILCWETGNELTSPEKWTFEITRYMKKLDPNHLVMDGWFSDDLDEPLVREASLNEWSIDMVSSHHYERDTTLVPGNIQRNIDLIKKRKVYLVGEFGFASTSSIQSTLDKVIAEPNDVMGALIWSLRHHNRDGGLYWHSEPLGAGLFKAFHWPGSNAGIAYDEENLMRMYRQKAFEIQNKDVPAVSLPLAPQMLPSNNVYSLNWRGSMGATGYNVERASHAKGPWTQIRFNVSEEEVPYFPLYNDDTAVIGQQYYYRVKAINPAGISKPSNSIGPITVNRLAKIDTMKNLGTVEDSKAIKSVMGGDRSFKELRYRLAGDYGSELTYSIPGTFQGVDIYAFEQTRFNYLEIQGSIDGKTWSVLPITPKSFVNSETNYSYWKPKLYAHHDMDKNFKFIKIFFKGGVAQLGRVEILYK